MWWKQTQLDRIENRLILMNVKLTEIQEREKKLMTSQENLTAAVATLAAAVDAAVAKIQEEAQVIAKEAADLAAALAAANTASNTAVIDSAVSNISAMTDKISAAVAAVANT